MTLAGYYNRQGQFDKTIDALEQRATAEPNNPEASSRPSPPTTGTNAQRNARLNENEKRDFVGEGARRRSTGRSKIKADYVEAITFKGLLLRLQANLEKDPAKQQALLKEAVSLQNQADEIRKKRTAGA